MWDFLTANPTVPLILVGTLIAYLSLRSQQHLTRAKHTLDFDKEFKDKHKTKLIAAKEVFGRRSWEELESLGRDGKLSTNPEDEFTVLVEAVNVWEGVAIGLKNKVNGEQQLFDAYGSTVVWLDRSTIPFVNARQSENPRLFCNFVEMSLRWSSRLSLPLAIQKQIERRETDAADAKAVALQDLRDRIRREVEADIAAEAANP